MERRIKLRHLRTFVAIVRQQSLKDAADVLNLTQPAVSKTLKELERILDATLLTRDRGGVRLTPEGELFLGSAETSLAALEQGVAGLARLHAGERGKLAVGALPSVAAHVLPRAALALDRIAPDIVLFCEEGPHGYLADRLRRGVLDVVVGRLGRPQTMEGIAFEQLYMEHVAFVTRPDHPLTGRRDLKAIADWPVIYPPEGSAIRPLVDRLMLAHGLGDLPHRVDSVSAAFGRGLTLRSDAVWVISQGVVTDDLAEGRLAALPVDTGMTAGPVGIMTRADDGAGRAVRKFRAALLDVTEALAR